MQGRIRAQAGWLVLAVIIQVTGGAKSAGEQETPGLLTRYVQEEDLTALKFGMRSHWLQPWRAYLETLPTSRLRQAVGINPGPGIPPEQADSVCWHLAKNGVRNLRIEWAWNAVRWDDPMKLTNQAAFDTLVRACKRYGLRPLFLLNGHHGMPCPAKSFTVLLTQPAKKGERTVHLDPATLKEAVVGRSGLSNLSGYWAAECLFTKIEKDGDVTLSRPLPKDLPAGRHPAATLKYLPFYPARLKATGMVAPEFAETMQGWLDYTQSIAANARRVLGTEGQPDAGFDLEIWNELSFGSNFLNINRYYDPPVVEGDNPIAEIVKQTVAFVRTPRNRLPNVGIANGFEAQRPWGAASTAPPGLTALSKHPYARSRVFPEVKATPNGIKALNALRQVDAVQLGPDAWKDNFVPAYIAYLPEYFLTAIQTETLIRDLAPITTEIFRVKHGRNTSPAGQPVGLWLTEVNLDPRGADPGYLFEYRAGGLTRVEPNLTPAHVERLKAKAVLRYLTAFVNKGVGRIYFYCAHDEDPMGLGLVRAEFFKVIQKNPETYPADDTRLTSPAMLAIRRLVQTMEGDLPASAIRPLSLLRIEEPEPQYQFAGDPRTASQSPDPRPPLANREVVGFFPFQATKTRYIIPVYVMTRNLALVYKKEAPAEDLTRYDMPPETFRLTLGHLSGKGAKVSLYDPLDGKDCPVKIVRADARELTVELGLTDSPRLLILTLGNAP